MCITSDAHLRGQLNAVRRAVYGRALDRRQGIAAHAARASRSIIVCRLCFPGEPSCHCSLLIVSRLIAATEMTSKTCCALTR